MELQRIIVFFCTLASGVSRPTLEDLKRKISCASQCAGYSALNLPMGSRLSYKYSTSTNTFLQGSAHKRSGISLESTAVIEVLARCHRVLKLQDVQMKTTFESREKLIKENGSLREALEQHPLWFCFHSGKILKIFPRESEPTWVLNIKRGILSVLQTSWVAAENSTVDEVDVLGKCPTKYQRKRSLLLKTKDLNLCSQRFLGFTSLRSVALPSEPSQQQFLSSRLECVQRFEGGILAEVKCTDSNRVTLSARKGSGAKTQTQTAMKLFRMETDITTERVDAKDLYESSLLYEREKPARQPSEEEMADLLQKLCMRPGVNPESTDLFMALVFELQHFSADALMNLWQRPPIKCRDNWQPLADALPSCTTEACVAVMKELIVSEEVDEDRIESFLGSLSFVPEPTAGMIDVLAPLLQLPRRRQSAFLGITALVHHFCSMRNGCDQDPSVLGIMRILGGHLGRKCAFHKSEGIDQVELVLKAIGNAGLAATLLTPVLSSCAALKSNPLEIRLAAIEAFRRIPCVANHTMLLQLYQTYSEDVEIRIASYLMSMKCPSEELFRQVKQTLQEEKSSQVGSFVWSHLAQLLETDDPLKQHLKHALPDDILSKEFDGETWKFSSYSDVSFHSALASGNMDAKLIFSPASFIPRVIATNLTVHLLGRAINILELGVRLENLEDVVQKVFGLHPVQNTKGKHPKPEPPIESEHTTQQNKLMSKRYSLRNDLPLKESKSKPTKGKQSCPSGQYNKMSELVKKFTKRMGKKKKPKCRLSIKVFGNELTILDCGDLRSQAKHYYLNLAELVIKLLKGQEVQFNKRMSLAREALLFPALSGLPTLLALNASAAINVTFRGNMDFKQRNNFFINGYIKPSAVLQISAQMGTVGTLGRSGLNWAVGLRSSTSLDGGVQVKKGKEFKVFLNTPEDSMDIFHLSSQLYITTADERQTVENLPGRSETKSCTNEKVSKTFGWQMCSEISTPNEETGSFLFPFPGPVKVAVTLKKQDTSLNQYLMKASYNYISQKGSRIPNEAGFHFFLGTPKSELKREVAIALYFNLPEKKFRIEFIHPKKKVQMSGKFEASRNSRMGDLELILDDSNVYYIRGRTDLQAVGGEQRYVAQLEAKLLKHGSPIVLSGNVTKQPGKKMALSVALVNLLKDVAFLSVCLEKKADDHLRQFSLEGETHIPGVLGSYIIGLLQQRGNLWSNALRIKYGLFGDAKNLQHECNIAQKLKMENSPHSVYSMDLEHEMFCTQILAYNHKVNLHHEEMAFQLHSKLEVSYGKHWDEINNKRKVLISQTFKNNSSPNLTSYLMEFTVQVPEKHVDYRTRLQHSHSTQSALESSTNFKVQYNNHMPFVADLQWKDASRHSLKKWEGMFNMDTPWLYLYAAHKLHQPQRSAYFAATEFTAGKAFVVKGLVMEIFCKDKGDEKEGRVWIHTPTTTYLQASTVNRLEKDSLHSQSEIVSLWNQLVKYELHVENREQAKSLHFMMTSAKQELNLTAAYFHLEAPKKTNVSIGVWWADHKNLPVTLQLEAQIEEMKKEKMLYQKRGTIQFRHPFKLPIPQSFLLQETFTVNKKEKHYFLETQVLINEQEESVQTLTLGYQAENPYICAGLVHPYNSEIFPQNLDVCAVSRNLHSAKCEVEATLKINKENVFRFLGKYQNKSSVANSQHRVQMDMTHSFQLKFPHSVAMNGELISKESKLAGFDWGLTANSTINRQDTSEFTAQLNRSESHLGIYSCLSHLNGSNFLPSFQVSMGKLLSEILRSCCQSVLTILNWVEQWSDSVGSSILDDYLFLYYWQLDQSIRLYTEAHATASHRGRNSLNGSFYLHSSGKDLVLLEASFDSEIKKSTRAIGVSALLKQAVLRQFRSVWLKFAGKASPSRLLLSSEMELNQNVVFHLDMIGSKEQKAGFLLTLHSSIRHNVDGLKRLIPPDFLLDGSLKQKSDAHEGALSVRVNGSVYGLHVENRHLFGNTSFHNISVAMTQNGSQAFPLEAQLRGQLELSGGIQRGTASFQVDTRALCIDVSSITIQEQMGVTGTFTHNMSTFYAAGLPTENSIMAVYGQAATNHTVTLKLQGGDRRVTAAFEVEALRFKALRVRLAARFNHNIAELEKHGIPFTVEGACHYQNFSHKLSVGATVQLDEEQFRVQLESQGTNSTAGFALFLHHDVDLFLHVIPPVVEVECEGESTSNQLSGHCSGEVAGESFEVHGSFSKLRQQQCALWRLSYGEESLSIGGCFRRRTRYELTGLFAHTFKYLCSLNIPRGFQVRVLVNPRVNKPLSMLNLTTDGWEVNSEGEARASSVFKWYGFASVTNPEVPTSKHTAEIRGSYDTEKCRFEGDARSSSNRQVGLLRLRSVCKGSYVLDIDLCHKPQSRSESEGRRFSLVMVNDFRKSHLMGKLDMEHGPKHLKMSGRVLLLANHSEVHWMWSHHWGSWEWGGLSILEDVQSNGQLKFDAFSLWAQTNCTVHRKPLEVEMETAWGPTLELNWLLRHSVPAWTDAGFPVRNWLHGVAQLGSRVDLSLEVMSGPCRITSVGRFGRRLYPEWSVAVHSHCPRLQTPVRITLNGSALPGNCAANFAGEVAVSDDAFTQILIHAACSPEHNVEISVTNTWAYLSALGLAKKNRIKIAAAKAEEYKGLLEVALGECVLTGDGELNTAGDTTTAEWRVKLLNKCDVLEKMTLPKNLVLRGSFFISAYNASVTVSLQCDGGAADLELEMSLADTSNMHLILGHSLPPLRHQGLPPDSSILLSVMNGSNLVGHLLLQVDNCKLKAEGELRATNRTEWTLEWETDCKRLQDLGAPDHSQVTGSIWKDGCQVECLNTLRSGSKEALLAVRTECQPKVTLEVELRHDLPFLRSVPDENKLFVDCGKRIGQDLHLDLKAGPCELRTGFRFHAANRHRWQLSMENDCKVIQDLGVPIKAEGVGHIAIGKMDLDSEVLITAGENTLHGLLTLNTTNARQELHALLMHNLQGPVHLGIPARTAVDLILEKKSAVRKRFLQFSVDGKQITEELSYAQKPDHVALKYKLRHNLEPLQAWWMEDAIELQATAVLKDVKNVTMKVRYGSCWVTFGGQIQKTNGSLDVRGNFQHKWSQLLQADIPEALQMLVSFKINAPQERRVQTVAGQALFTYSADSIRVDHPSDICSRHSDVALVTSSCPKAINLTFMLQKLENKARLAFQGEWNNKTLSVILDVFSGVEPHGPFELTVQIQHSVSQLKHLGIPSSLKLTLLEILSANQAEGTLKVSCDSDLSLLFVLSAHNERQSEEFRVKSLQNLPFLLQYLPSMAEFSSKVNYSTKEAVEKLSIHMENKESLVLTKVTSTGPTRTHVLQLTHTMPQLTILPRQLVLTTAYQKSKRTRALRWTALWDGKEANFTGSYTGLFPKVSGGHDVKVEICHPLSVPFPKHSMLKVYIEHSLRRHKDDIVIGWDSKEQISVSSSLKFEKEHINYHATIAHPFNFTVNQMEVNSLTESRRGTRSQQMQLTWNDGQPAYLNCTFRDKSKANGTFWDACIAASSSQLRNVLPAGTLQACGSIEQTTALFNQQLDVKWDSKKVKQNLTFEKSRPFHRDTFHLDAILENIFLTSCSSQQMVGNVETDYSAWLNYHASLRVCDLPNEIAIFGRHQLNKGDLLLQSEGKVSLAGDEGSFTVALRNGSKAKEKNYSVQFALKASEAVWLNVTGSLTSSAGQSQVTVEGNIDPKEKVKLAASKEEKCLRYYMGYSKGSSEDGLEFTACTDGRQQATVDAQVVMNGAIQEELGRLALQATNQSLSLEAHGCGDAVIKIESKLTEIASTLQRGLLVKLKNLEERFGDFRKSVQHIDFLYAAAGWPVNVLQEAAGILQNGARGITQLWKQGGVKHSLQHSLPRYLGKLQGIIQQMQNELRRPLTTLKEAYYDATLKPLDEVWQQKTEECLKKLQAFVPTILKDVWLMEPIQISLRMLKTGLDTVTQQMLSWAEDKLSRAVSKIQKPLSNLYSFSARNCSVAVKLPVASNREPTLDLANITNYLIEEKLMKPFRGLYHINPAAEYYRFKRTMMESPFEHHALLMGSKHLRTFDGNIYSLSSNCSVLLAKDFVHDAFTVILNQDRNGMRSLHVDMNGTSVTIYPEQKIYKKSNISQIEENCQNLDMPLEGSGVAVRREPDYIEVSGPSGVRFSCDLRYDLCTLTLDGWHHGTSAGLFGTNDNEAGNEWKLPDHSYAGSVQEFVHGWQVSNQCPPVKKLDKSCPSSTSSQICKTFFRDSRSFFRNCFSVVDPEPFYSLCTVDMCELHNIKSACSLAAAFVHLCNRNFVPLEIPLQCDWELRLRDST